MQARASARCLVVKAAARPAAPRQRRAVAVCADAGAAAVDDYCPLPEGWEPPSQSKRATMNLLLAATVALPVAGMAGPYAASFVPKRCAAAADAVAHLTLLHPCHAHASPQPSP